jgi:hypothetical protein
MKKISIIFGVIIVLVLVIIYGWNRMISPSCGSNFVKEYKNAVASNNLNFCSTYTGKLNYSIDWGYGHSCLITKGNIGITESNFIGSCYRSFGIDTNNVEVCKSSDNNIGCVLAIVQNTGKKEYCSYITEDELIRKRVCLGDRTVTPASIQAEKEKSQAQ